MVTLIRTSELRKRIDIVKLAGLDQGRDDSPVFGPTAGSGKRRVFVGDVPIGVELREADVAGMNVTRPSSRGQLA